MAACDPGAQISRALKTWASPRSRNKPRPYRIATDSCTVLHPPDCSMLRCKVCVGALPLAGFKLNGFG